MLTVIMEQYTRCRIYTILLHVIIGMSILIPSVIMHEVGHVIACMWLGFEVIELNLLSSYMICSDSDNQIIHVMGGAVSGASMLPFLLVRKIRRYLPISFGLISVSTAQLLNMILEGFSNQLYREADLENLVLVFGIVMIITLGFLLHTKPKY